MAGEEIGRIGRVMGLPLIRGITRACSVYEHATDSSGVIPMPIK
jgi:hypothetical protein